MISAALVHAMLIHISKVINEIKLDMPLNASTRVVI
jgi:hypothetical protein